MKPRTQEQWIQVLDIIELFLARLREGDYERLRKLLEADRYGPKEG